MTYFTVAELNPHNYPLTEEVNNNLLDLIERASKLRMAYGLPLTVTSGLRSIEQHIAIYKAKGVPENRIPMGSRHLTGQAMDLFDPNKQFQDWILRNIHKLEEIGLWCEAFSATPNWVHIQTRPPRSNNRFFIP